MAGRTTFRTFIREEGGSAIELFQPLTYVKTKNKIPRVRFHHTVLDLMCYYDVLVVNTDFENEKLTYTLRTVTKENNSDGSEAQHEAPPESVELQGEAP